MFKRMVLGVFVLTFVLAYAGIAMGQERVQGYFNDTVCKVKATDDPSQKREILNIELQRMSKALERVENSSLVSEADRENMGHFRTSIQEKTDELAGNNGYERVPDDQLDTFSDYVMQDMEQADKTITMGVVTALLIVILIILVT